MIVHPKYFVRSHNLNIWQDFSASGSWWTVDETRHFSSRDVASGSSFPGLQLPSSSQTQVLCLLDTGSFSAQHTKLGGNYQFRYFFLTFYHKTGNIFLPKSTFNEGRNALLRHALAMEQTPGYEYFIFLDDDVDLVTVNEVKHFWREDMEENPWRRFEQFLEKFAPRVGFARYSN